MIVKVYIYVINVPDDDDDNDNDNECANIIKGYKTALCFFVLPNAFLFLPANMGVGARRLLSVWWRCCNTHRIHGTGIYLPTFGINLW